MNHRRARGRIVAAALTLLLCTPHAAIAAGGSSLKALVDRYVAWRTARAPFAARSVETPLAVTVTPATRDAERAWLAGFRADLAAASAARATITDGDAAQQAMLEAAVSYDSLELEVLRPFERDPATYLDLIAVSVQTALDRSSDSPCARVRRAIARLVEAPEVLRTARVNLADPPALLMRHAIVRARALVRFFRADLPRLAAGCRAPGMQAELAEADTMAVRAVQEYLAFLEQERPPGSRGEVAIGPEACRRLLQAMLMSEVPPVDSLLETGRLTVEAERAGLDSLAAGLSAAGTRVVLDSIAATAPAESSLAAAGRQAMVRVRDFLRASDLVTVPDKFNLAAREALAIDPEDDPTLAASPAGGSREQTAWLGIARDHAGRFALDLSAAAEMGRRLRDQTARGDAYRLGRAARDIWPGRDWGQYLVHTMIEAGYGSRDPRYRVALAARELEEAGRSYVSLALHAGMLSAEEAQRVLEERCLLDSARAERDVRWAASDARLMGYTIGAQRLLGLQEEAWRRLGSRFRARSFNDAVLRCGVAPCGYVRSRVWHELAVATGSVPLGAEP